MAISLIRRAVVCASFVALAISLSGQPALADDDDDNGARTRRVNCAKPKGSIQKKLDKVKHGRPTRFVIKGTCTEDVTVTKDDVTFEGADGSATVDGTFTVIGAQRVGFKHLKITGSGSGVICTDNASCTIEYSEIVENDEDGIQVLKGSTAWILDSDIKDNGQAGLVTGDGGPGWGVLVQDSASADIVGNDIHDNRADGVLVNEGAFARIEDNDIKGNGLLALFQAGVNVSRSVVIANGNKYKDNGFFAIAVFNDSSYRTGTFVNAADNPSNLFAFEEIDQGTGTVAVGLGQMSYVDLRQVMVTGLIDVGHHSMLQIRGDNVTPNKKCSEVDGNIIANGIFAVVSLSKVDVTGGVSLGADARLSGNTECKNKKS